VQQVALSFSVCVLELFWAFFEFVTTLLINILVGLLEFDEGKRSCRRRLAGHNRRRRKAQPEDVTSRLLLTGNRDNTAATANLDIVNLLTAIARTQGKRDWLKCKFGFALAHLTFC
jgi:hypothetical protein